MSRHMGVAAFVAGAAILGGCSSSTTTDGGDGGGSCFLPDASEQNIAAAFNTATDGTTLTFCAGTFQFSNTLNIAAKNLTVRGAGADQTILDFAGQTGGADGIYGVQGTDNVLLTGFTVRDPKGNGIRIENSSGITMDGVNVLWTGSNASAHGAYGLYPVLDKSVLVQNCNVQGASDTGIYVGQSDGVIVKNNVATMNVSGIEIENTFNADVHDNDAHDNTAGILVFDLPGKLQQGGHNVRIFNNTINHNNTPNFAAQGNIVAMVPAGTGFFVMANHDVEVFGNTVHQNQTAALSVISYLLTGDPLGDGGYYPYPSRIYMHDNDAPCDGSANTNGYSADINVPLGLVLATVQDNFPNNILPSLIYDGIVDPTVDAGVWPDSMTICFHNNSLGPIQTDGGFTGFMNMHLDQFDQANPNLGQILTQDLPDYTCTLPSLPPVTL